MANDPTQQSNTKKITIITLIASFIIAGFFAFIFYN